MENELGEKLFSSYYMRVYSFLMAMCRDGDMAEELTQRTFFKAFTASGGYRGEADEATWLCAIAKNLYADELRRRKRTSELPPDADAGIDIEADVSDRELSFRIHLALHELNEPYREVFELRVFGELSFRQIGAIFGKTETWARVTYHRARLRIQERMDEK